MYLIRNFIKKCLHLHINKRGYIFILDKDGKILIFNCLKNYDSWK